MTLHQQSPKRFTAIRKVPSERNKEYVQCKIEQRSNQVQYRQLQVPSEAAETAAHVYLGYRRCSEFDSGNQPGQDYAVVRIGGGYVVGVVADGVSRSFYGNLAAEYLSKWLVNELWQRRTATPDEQLMDSLLKEVEAKFAESIRDFPISAELPATLRTTLERKRPKGSQTVFAAFVLEVARGQLTLYQVGDVKAVIHNSNPEPDLVEAASEGRWSSAGQSNRLLKRTMSENVEGLVIKSDGVSHEWGHTLEESTFDADQFSQMTEMCSPLDDISFIAVRRYQVGRPAALLPAAQNELLSATSDDADSEETVLESQPAQQPVASDFGPDHATQTHDVSGAAEKKQDVTIPPLQGQDVARLEAHSRRRNLKVFLAGTTVGAALMYLAFSATERPKMETLEGKQVARQTNLNPTSDQRSSAAPDGGNITIEVKETEQIKFQKEHASSFPPLIGGNPTTRRGEVIAHVSTGNINVDRVEFVRSDKEKTATQRARDGDRSSFFVRLSGLPESKTVTIRLVDPQGKAIGEFHEKMRGREKSGAANQDPFLGYHEISIRGAQ